MSAKIKAIETIYRGYRFRSRLEARWAVFFDGIKVRFEYEKDGFELPQGGRYLPDFYLPELGVAVEVKPHKGISRSELEKIIKFGIDARQSLLLIVGQPGDEDMYLLRPGEFPTWQALCEAAEAGTTHEEQLLAFMADLHSYSLVQFGVPAFDSQHLGLVYRTLPPLPAVRIAEAYLAARQARFEGK